MQSCTSRLLAQRLARRSRGSSSTTTTTTTTLTKRTKATQTLVRKQHPVAMIQATNVRVHPSNTTTTANTTASTELQRPNLVQQLQQQRPATSYQQPRITLTRHHSSSSSSSRTVEQLILAATHDDHSDASNSSTQEMVVDMGALQRLAAQRTTPLRLADMYKYAVQTEDLSQRLLNAQFLWKELPIRLAQRAMDLLTLPHGLNETRGISNVAHQYLKYLELFQHVPKPTTNEEETLFTDVLEKVILDRTTIPTAIYQGIASWKQQHQSINVQESEEMERALYRFFTARVGVRFLMEHHILSSPKRHKKYHDMQNNVSEKTTKTEGLPCSNDNRIVPGHGDFLGCIQTHCDALCEVQKVAALVKEQTLQQFGVAPEILVVDSSSPDNRTDNVFTYVPHHLQYMVAELLKNASRATVLRHHHAKNKGQALPPIKAVVVKGAEDVSIKIADQGGGAPRSTMEQIWKFAHSSHKDENDKKTVDETSARGFGLPLARIYARYFGGELTLRSMEGYGVDAYLYLPRLGQNGEELPASVATSPGESDSSPAPEAFWSNSKPVVSRGATEPLTPLQRERTAMDIAQRKAL